MAISGDYIVVGAVETHASMLSDDAADPSQGAALLFSVRGDYLGVLNGPTPHHASPTVGSSVAVHGNLVLVGDISAPLTEGRGAVYAYEVDFASAEANGRAYANPRWVLGLIAHALCCIRLLFLV